MAQVFDEQGAGQPFEAPFEVVRIGRVGFGGALAVVGLGAQAIGGGRDDLGGVGDFLVSVVIAVGGHRIFGVFIVKSGVEKFGTLRSQGDVQALFDGIKHDEVAQDVAFDGEQKCWASALQPFEQVGAAKAHEPCASA